MQTGRGCCRPCFITEEETPDQPDKVLKWIIDPLDGTTNYLHGLPVFAVSVALMEEDELLAGVVYELGQDEMFTAWRGGGAYLNGKPIKLKVLINHCGWPWWPPVFPTMSLKTWRHSWIRCKFKKPAVYAG
ncbi:MAG: inositol monophosphatase family protein [Owenweeksia sp.]|nr:inositol monophosphatase family protein [Owenweeksia sp.]